VVADRYVAWLRRNASAIIAIHAVAFAAAIYLVAFRLPLYADFSYLLPQDVPAVRDLRRLESRVKSTDTVLAIVRAPTPAARAAAVQDLATGIGWIRPQLIERVDADDKDVREFLQAHRDVLVPLGDLERARDALREKLTARSTSTSKITPPTTPRRAKISTNCARASAKPTTNYRGRATCRKTASSR
jgi:hypothetical protein